MRVPRSEAWQCLAFGNGPFLTELPATARTREVGSPVRGEIFVGSSQIEIQSSVRSGIGFAARFPFHWLADEYVAPTELDCFPGLAFYKGAAPHGASCKRAKRRRREPRQGRNL